MSDKLSNRQLDFPASEEFIARWSPRAFTAETIDEGTLFTILEAARWAPSSLNLQPWHFVFALRGKEGWDDFLNGLKPANQAWAKEAAALTLVLSRKTFMRQGESMEVPSPTHAFDAGCAWGYLALQAHRLGWATHAMAGIEEPALRQSLAIPDEYQINAAVAIGRQGNPADLSEALRARETPSPRRPLAQSVSKGRFAK